MDLFTSVFGDNYTREMLAAIGLLLVLAVLWLVWKFFFALFKHVLMALFLAIIGSGIYFYLFNRPPAPDPNVGKYAYGASSNRYLGIIESADADSYIVKQGNYPTKYAKGRIIVKDKLEPTATPTAAPSPSVTPKPRSANPPKRRA